MLFGREAPLEVDAGELVRKPVRVVGRLAMGRVALNADDEVLFRAICPVHAAPFEPARPGGRIAAAPRAEQRVEQRQLVRQTAFRGEHDVPANRGLLHREKLARAAGREARPVRLLPHMGPDALRRPSSASVGSEGDEPGSSGREANQRMVEPNTVSRPPSAARPAPHARRGAPFLQALGIHIRQRRAPARRLDLAPGSSTRETRERGRRVKALPVPEPERDRLHQQGGDARLLPRPRPRARAVSSSNRPPDSLPSPRSSRWRTC